MKSAIFLLIVFIISCKENNKGVTSKENFINYSSKSVLSVINKQSLDFPHDPHLFKIVLTRVYSQTFLIISPIYNKISIENEKPYDVLVNDNNMFLLFCGLENFQYSNDKKISNDYRIDSMCKVHKITEDINKAIDTYPKFFLIKGDIIQPYNDVELYKFFLGLKEEKPKIDSN